MNFYSVRDLRTTQKAIWEKLEQDGEVVITNNGKPSALLFDIGDGDLEETLKAVRQAKAMMAFNSMRGKAAEKGYMSDEEIGAMMNVVRSTVFRHRKNALAKMKKFMEEKKNDEHK